MEKVGLIGMSLHKFLTEYCEKDAIISVYALSSENSYYLNYHGECGSFVEDILGNALTLMYGLGKVYAGQKSLIILLKGGNDA